MIECRPKNRNTWYKNNENLELFASFFRDSFFAQPGKFAQGAPSWDFQDCFFFIFGEQFLFRNTDGAKCLDKLKVHYARERSKIACCWGAFSSILIKSTERSFRKKRVKNSLRNGICVSSKGEHERTTIFLYFFVACLEYFFC